MVPPKPEGHQYFYALMNPKNYRKETFIDQVQQRVFVEQIHKKLETESSDEDCEPVANFPKFVNITDPIYQAKMPQNSKGRVILKAKPRSIFTAADFARP